MSKPIASIEDLRPDPANANRGTPRGHGLINRSLRERGAARSGVAAADGTMIAGSQTLEEVAALGLPIRAVHTTGDEWVVVVRDDIAPGSPEARLLAIEDNRTAQLGLDWAPDVLAQLTAETPDVLAELWRPDELAELLAAAEPVDPNELWQGMPEFEQEYAGDVRSITVHFRTEDDIRAFAELVGQAITPQTKSIFYPKRERVDFKEHRVQDES